MLKTPDGKFVRQSTAAIVATPNSICHIDFAADLPPAGERPQKRRRRNRAGQRIPDAVSNFAFVNDARCCILSQQRQLAAQVQPPGTNARVLPLDSACLHCAFTSPCTAVLVEQAWSEVIKSFPEPLYRHRYGS